jgi:putative endonuclease
MARPKLTAARRPPKRHFAYLLRCADNSLYAGYTRDLKAREARHNDGHGGRYTASRLPVRIVYSERFETQQLAMAREYAFKQLRKIEKEALVRRRRRRSPRPKKTTGTSG